jgi:hypothetical protein
MSILFTIILSTIVTLLEAITQLENVSNSADKTSEQPEET